VTGTWIVEEAPRHSTVKPLASNEVFAPVARFRPVDRLRFWSIRIAAPPGHAFQVAAVVRPGGVGDRGEKRGEELHPIEEASLGRIQRQGEELSEAVGEFVERVDFEPEGHAFIGAEEIDRDRDRMALHVFEEKRRAAGLDRAVGDLRDLQVLRDLGLDPVKKILLLEEFDEMLEVAIGHSGRSISNWARQASSRHYASRITEPFGTSRY
jgi:hypothetical protein